MSSGKEQDTICVIQQHYSFTAAVMLRRFYYSEKQAIAFYFTRTTRYLLVLQNNCGVVIRNTY